MVAPRLSLAVLLSLCACAREVGSGVRTTEVRPVPEFSRTSINSGFRATVSIGPRHVELTADDNLLQYLETIVEGETLVVRVRPGLTVTSIGGLEARIVTPQLMALDASGGAQVSASASPTTTFPVVASGGSLVTLEGLDCDQLNLDASGGSKLVLSGAAEAIGAVASGGSRIEADGVPANRVVLDGSGGSALFFRASGSVTGVLSGGSKATVTGNPSTRQVSTSGGSEVIWIGD